MSTRRLAATGVVLLLGLGGPLASRASAQTPRDPLPQWTISADVVETWQGGGYSETFKASHQETSAQSGAVTWTGSRTGSGRFDCPVSGFNGYDTEGSGTGTGHFDALVATGPGYWGLPIDRAYSVVRTVAQGDYALTSTTYNCNGESETGPAGREGPREAVVYLEGTPEELAALPVGTKRQMTYSHTDAGETEVKTTISYTATKANVPPPPPAACADGIDNDRDGTVDHGADPGCITLLDDDELGATACDNGIDDDNDGHADVAGRDPGCPSPADNDERDPTALLTVIFDGPGSVAGGNLSNCVAVTASHPGRCEAEQALGDRISLHGGEFAAGAFLRWEGCDTAIANGCNLAMTRDRTVTVHFDPVRSYAPQAYFHSDEEYGAMDPDKFFARASLYWFNKMGGKVRDAIPFGGGEPCRSHHFDQGIRVRKASRTELTVKRLKAGEWRHSYCYMKGAPKGGRVKGSAGSNELTAPAAKGSAGKSSPGHSGFYLQLPEDSKSDKRFLQGVNPSKGSGAYKGPKMRYEFEPGRSLVYWFFLGYNNRGGDRHQGDWEHLAVRLDSRNLGVQLAYYNHLCEPHLKGFADVALVNVSHPVAYIAAGGHGIWATTGRDIGSTCPITKPVPRLPSGWWNTPYAPPGGFNDVRDRGRSWRTWDRELIDVKSESWYGAGVGWGKEGGIGWGPLGPGPRKTNVLPENW